MRRAPLAVLVPVALVAGLLAAPSGVLAADPVTVTGTVVRDGSPVTGASIQVRILGGDAVAATTTDESGAFTVDIDAVPGDAVRVSALGQASQSAPDTRGCVSVEQPAGHVDLSLDAIPPAPVAVTLDQLVTGTVCAATAAPGITPPATDLSAAPGPGAPSGGGLLMVLSVLAVAGGSSLAIAGGASLPRTSRRG